MSKTSLAFDRSRYLHSLQKTKILTRFKTFLGSFFSHTNTHNWTNHFSYRYYVIGRAKIFQFSPCKVRTNTGNESVTSGIKKLTFNLAFRWSVHVGSQFLCVHQVDPDTLYISTLFSSWRFKFSCYSEVVTEIYKGCFITLYH